MSCFSLSLLSVSVLLSFFILPSLGCNLPLNKSTDITSIDFHSLLPTLHSNVSNPLIHHLDDNSLSNNTETNEYFSSYQDRIAYHHTTSIPFDFEPKEDEDPWARTFYYMYRDTNDSGYMNSKPVITKSSATVDGVYCYVYDDNALYNLTVKLVKKDYGGYQYCGSITSAGSSGNQAINTGNSCTQKVGYQATSTNYCSYLIEVYSPIYSSSLRVYQCSIKYH